MRTFAASLMAVALALAGCTESAPDPPATFTCPDGAVVPVPANATANPAAGCPKPAPPTVTLRTQAAQVRVFSVTPFTWTLTSGNYTRGHSMLSSLRISNVSDPTGASLSGAESYGREIARAEHQNLPATLDARHSFTVPGTYYLRVYATIQGDGLDAADFWSAEQTLVVDDVAATGNNTVVVHPVGNSAGMLSPATVDIGLGDGIVLKNDDVTEHVFMPVVCDQFKESFRVAAMASSDPIVFKAPGTCTFNTDDVRPQTLTVNVG